MLKVMKFLASGGVAAATEYVSFVLMQAASLSLLISQTGSFLCGFVVSFSLNRLWVFKSGNQLKQQIIRYSILAVINLVITNILMNIFINSLSINNLIAKIIMMAIVAVWNYLIFSKLIFNQKNKTLKH